MSGKVKCVLVMVAMLLMAASLAAPVFADEPVHRRYMGISSPEERGDLMRQFARELEAALGTYERKLCRNELILADPRASGGNKASCDDISAILRRNLRDSKDRAEGYTHINTSEFGTARTRDSSSREYGKTYLRIVPRIPWDTTTNLQPRLTFTYLHDGFISSSRIARNSRPLTSAFQDGLVLRVKLSRGSGGSNCFVAGTLVLMADGTFKPIEDVVIGDRVFSRDARTGKDMTAEVYKLLRGTETAVYKFDDGLQVNADHRFYTDKGPVLAGNLKPGAVLVGRDGSRTLCSIDKQGPTLASAKPGMVPSIPVYNIMVRGTHTFFVSPDGHNTYMVLDISACGR